MKIAVLFAMGLVVLAGCAPVATYPPIQGTGQLSGPSIEPIPVLMTKSIRYAQRRYGDGAEEFAINLPPQTPPAV